MKYYFFRDLDHRSNYVDGITFHAAGIVDKVFNSRENATGNKDLSVTFLEPFDVTISSEWRTYKEVELFEVEEYTWKALRDDLNKAENVL